MAERDDQIVRLCGESMSLGVFTAALEACDENKVIAGVDTSEIQKALEKFLQQTALGVAERIVNLSK
jgi:hypothetical protein